MNRAGFIPTGLLCAALALLVPSPAWSDHEKWVSLEQSAEQAFVKGDDKAAESYWRQALAEGQADDPQGLDVATTLNQMTHLYIKERQYDAAREACEKALSIRKEKLGKENMLTAQTMGNLALVSHKLGRDSDAEQLYEDVLQIKEKLVGKDAPELAVTMHNLANLLSAHRKCDRAKELYVRVAAIDKKALGADHIELAKDLTSLGIHLYKCNACGEAVENLTEALRVAEEAEGSDSPELVPTLHYLGLAHARQKEPDKAKVFYNRALAIQQRVHGKGHPETAVHMLNVARNADELGQTEDAERLYLEILEALQSQINQDEFRLAECNLELAHFYRRHKDTDKADRYFRDALDAYDKLNRHQQRALYEVPLAYSHLLKDLGRTEESREMEKRYLHVHKPEKGEHFRTE